MRGADGASSNRTTSRTRSLLGPDTVLHGRSFVKLCVHHRRTRRVGAHRSLRRTFIPAYGLREPSVQQAASADGYACDLTLGWATDPYSSGFGSIDSLDVKNNLEDGAPLTLSKLI